jgi:hypothetical protein
MIHSRLLSRNSQNPTLRRVVEREPTHHAAARVTTIAGHWIAFMATVMRDGAEWVRHAGIAQTDQTERTVSLSGGNGAGTGI